MPRRINPLADLAWATKSEDAIVGQLANDLVREGYRWSRGYMTDIRERVKETRPHRGIGRKRLDAVRDAMLEQRKVRRNREGNRPIDWSAWTPNSVERRRSHIWERLTGLSEGVPVFSRIAGRRVIIAGGYRSKRLYILDGRPTGRIFALAESQEPDESLVKIGISFGDYGSSYDHILDMIVSWHRRKLNLNLKQGGSFRVDWDTHETVMLVPVGRSVDVTATPLAGRVYREERLPWPGRTLIYTRKR